MKKVAAKKRKKKVKEAGPAEMERLGLRIKRLRIKSGYNSGEAFALDHDISRTHYGRWERGANITYMNLVKLARAFRVTLEEFFSEGFD